MSDEVHTTPSVARFDLYRWLGITVGVIMPVLSQILYPVYMHQMQPEWAEWTRLLELPFVASELVIIQLAIRRGYRDREVWQRLPKDIMVALVLLVVGLTVSSVFMSKKPAVSIALSLTTLVHLRFAAAIFWMARPVPVIKVHHLLRGLGCGLIVLTLLTIWKFSFPPPAWSVPGGKIEWPSALPGFISVRHFGSWTGAIAAGLMISLLYGEQRPSHIDRLLYLLAAGLTCWSGTRAAVLAMVVVALIVLISLRRFPNRNSLLQVGGLSALALIGAVLLYPGIPDFALFVQGDMQSPDTLASGRLELWHDAICRWIESPVFGWGSGSTFWEVNIGWAHTQPHNFIIQFLISWGLVGSAGGIWIIGRSLKHNHYVGMQNAIMRPIAAMLYSLLFMSLLEGMLYYPRFIMLICICIGVLFSARDSLKIE